MSLMNIVVIINRFVPPSNLLVSTGERPVCCMLLLLWFFAGHSCVHIFIANNKTLQLC